MNRLQTCYNVSRAMHAILGKVQHQAKGWVGLSVIHLGDRDVPNALMFIDKYPAYNQLAILLHLTNYYIYTSITYFSTFDRLCL